MTDQIKHQAAALPPDILALMQERLETVKDAIVAMENTPQVRSLLAVRNALAQEETRLIAALDEEKA